MTAPEVRKSKLVPLTKLTPHPRNYRGHPEDQLDEVRASLRQHGVYKNIVISSDWFILAGHGVAEAAELEGVAKLQAVQMDYPHDDPRAINLVIADNSLSLFAEDNDRLLTELLKEQADQGMLLGTGYDEQKLAALLMVTRPASEIADFDAAAEWVGMPEFDHTPMTLELRIVFDAEDPEAERQKVADQLGYEERTLRHGARVWTGYWPPREQDDPGSILFE